MMVVVQSIPIVFQLHDLVLYILASAHDLHHLKVQVKFIKLLVYWFIVSLYYLPLDWDLFLYFAQLIVPLNIITTNIIQNCVIKLRNLLVILYLPTTMLRTNLYPYRKFQHHFEWEFNKTLPLSINSCNKMNKTNIKNNHFPVF